VENDDVQFRREKIQFFLKIMVNFGTRFAEKRDTELELPVGSTECLRNAELRDGDHFFSVRKHQSRV
jgi:hypothetical protein